MKIYLGDNQFIGVNHASEERAFNRAIKFEDSTEITNLVKHSCSIGYDGFFCTIHEKLIPLFKEWSTDEILSSMPIHACIPYAHKYSDIISDYGWFGALKHLGGNNLNNLLIGGFKAYAGKKPGKLIKGVLGAELSFLKNLNLKSVFIQNVATDFLLGLQAYDILADIINQIITHFNKECGLITFNPIQTIEFLNKYNLLSEVTICTSINIEGFRMNPSQLVLEKAIKQSNAKFMAMSIFSSGSSTSRDSINYIKSLNLSSVVLGTSNINYLEQNILSLK